LGDPQDQSGLAIKLLKILARIYEQKRRLMILTLEGGRGRVLDVLLMLASRAVSIPITREGRAQPPRSRLPLGGIEAGCLQKGLAIMTSGGSRCRRTDHRQEHQRNPDTSAPNGNWRNNYLLIY
jgi:hypothetical protein